MLIRGRKFVVFEIIQERVSRGQDSSGGSVIGPESETFSTNSAAKTRSMGLI
ncbi:18112_t:CDS:1, partial [Gigaspora rosea]